MFKGISQKRPKADAACRGAPGMEEKRRQRLHSVAFFKNVCFSGWRLRRSMISRERSFSGENHRDCDERFVKRGDFRVNGKDTSDEWGY